MDTQSLRKFAEDITGWQVRDTAITGITVRALSRRLHRPVASSIRVGQELSPDLSGAPHEPIGAIFESNQYLVVTPDTVYFFAPDEVTAVERA